MILQHVDTLIHEITIMPLLQHAGSGFGETVKGVTRSIFQNANKSHREPSQIATNVGKEYLTHIGKGAGDLALGVAQLATANHIKDLEILRNNTRPFLKKIIPEHFHDSIDKKIGGTVSDNRQKGANNIAKGLGRAAAIYAPVYATDKVIDHQVHEHRRRKQYRELEEMFKLERKPVYG